MRKAALYVIKSEHGPVKVGISNNPARRLASLQAGSPAKLALAHVESISDLSALTVERAAHDLLRAVHSHGEWFDADAADAVAAIREAITTLRASPHVPTADVDEAVQSAAMMLLREGVASPSEVAEIAGVSRQLVRHWLMAAGIDWRKQRDAYLAKHWRRAINRTRPT